MESAAE